MVQFLVKNFFQILCLLRIDFYFFLFQIGTNLIEIPVNQLVQDKICLNNLSLNDTICYNLTKISGENVENIVLEEATFIKNYQILISLAPGIVLSLFLGRWMDLYPGHIKYLLAFPCLGGVIQSLFLVYLTIYWETDARRTIYSYISYGITGGETLASIGSYTYVARKTAIDYRPLRFAVIEFCRLAANPLASVLGGKLLSLSPLFDIGLRNYIGVFLIFGLIKTITALWVLVTLNDADESSSLTFQTNPGVPIEWRGKESTGKSFVSNVFNLSNLSQTLQTVLRSRPNGQRGQLWHLILASSLTSWGLLAESSIGFQFAEKVYKWDYEFFSYISAIVGLAPMVFKPVATYILIHRFYIRDTSLAAIGCVSMIINVAVRGAVLTPLGYYLTILTYVNMGLAPVGLRSTITRVVDYNEIAQIYTIITLISSVSPIIGTMLITYIFTETLEAFPGMTYHFIALILLYPLGVIFVVDLAQRHYDNLEINGKATYIQAERPTSAMVEIEVERRRANTQV